MKAISHHQTRINKDALSFTIGNDTSVRVASHGRTAIHISGHFEGKTFGCAMWAEEFVIWMMMMSETKTNEDPKSAL